MEYYNIYILKCLVIACAITIGSCQNCADPAGIANGRIISTGPYASGSQVVYACEDGFAMTGTPSQSCSSSLSWTGTIPTCTAIDNAPRVDNAQSVTVEYPNMPTWIILLLMAMMFIALCLMAVAVILVLCKKDGQNNNNSSNADQTKKVVRVTGGGHTGI